MIPVFQRIVGGRKYTVLQDSKKRYLSINGTATTQSIGGTGSSGSYYDDVASAIVKHGCSSVLILGLAGGTIARRIKETARYSTVIYGVDNDEIMVDIGIRFFDLQKYTDQIYIEDARDYVLGCMGRVSFDAVVVDCFADGTRQVHIPAARALVSPGGLYIVNNFRDGLSIERL